MASTISLNDVRLQSSWNQRGPKGRWTFRHSVRISIVFAFDSIPSASAMMPHRRADSGPRAPPPPVIACPAPSGDLPGAPRNVAPGRDAPRR